MAATEPKGDESSASVGRDPRADEIRLYSRSDIFYWWPVWGLGYLLALLTYLDGGHLAVVPQGTEARRDWRVEIGHGRVETREGLILPPIDPDHPAHLPPPGIKGRLSPLPPPEQPHVHIASSPYLGTWFFLTLLLVFVSTHAPLRGLWEWIAVLFIALVVSLIALYGLWGTIREWFVLLHVRITMTGYLFLSTWLFAIWLVTFLYFDRLTYIIFTTGQVRVRRAIGEGEKAYDVTNLSLELQPNVFFRHRILGLYDAGDLIIRTGGPQSDVIPWPNVLRVRSQMRKIERLIQTREVQ